MLKYIFRENGQFYEVTSGGIVDFGSANHSLGSQDLVNNKYFSSHRGTIWVASSITQNRRSTGSLEVVDNSIITSNTMLGIGTFTLTEGVDWNIGSSASGTTSSIINSIQNKSVLNTKVNVISGTSTKFFLRTTSSGPGSTLQFSLSDISGFELNQGSGSVVEITGGSVGQNFTLNRYRSSLTNFSEVFNEDTTPQYPSVAGYPFSVALETIGNTLYYVYIRPNWDKSKLILGYRTFDLVNAVGATSSAPTEKEFNFDPSNYDSIGDLKVFNQRLYVNIVKLNQILKVFEININSSIIKEINVSKTYTGNAGQFLLASGGLYLFNQSDSPSVLSSGAFVSATNTNTPPQIDKRFKFGVDKYNDKVYWVYTDTTWQGQLYSTSGLTFNANWIQESTVGPPLIYQDFSARTSVDPNKDVLGILGQTSSGSAQFYNFNASGLSLQASLNPATKSAGLLEFNKSHPAVTIERVNTNFTGTVTIMYRLYDLESDNINVRFEFSSDGVSWNPGTISSGSVSAGTLTASGVILNVPSLPPNRASNFDGGKIHSFNWDSVADLGFGKRDVQIRLLPYTGI